MKLVIGKITEGNTREAPRNSRRVGTSYLEAEEHKVFF